MENIEIYKYIRNMKILFADDDNNQLEILRKWSKLKGYDAKFASNGKEALRAYEEEGFDVAVLDVDMPEMDGLTTAEELARLNPQIKVIIFTGLMPNRPLPNVVKKVLLKPLSLIKLSKEIASLEK